MGSLTREVSRMTIRANSMISSVMSMQTCQNLLRKDQTPQPQEHSVEARNLSHCQEGSQLFPQETPLLTSINLKHHRKVNHLQVTRQKAIQSPKLRSRLHQLHQMAGGPTGPVYLPQVRLRDKHPLGDEAVLMRCQPPLQTTRVTEGLFSPRLLQKNKIGGQVALKKVIAMRNNNQFGDSPVKIPNQ